MGSVTISNTQPSLLRYLSQGRHGFRLNLSVLPADKRRKALASPFPLVGDCGPFAHITEAAIVTDADCFVKPVVLLKTSDVYSARPDDLWPVNNDETGRLWQQAFSWYLKNADSGSPGARLIVLREQLDDSGAILPFCSLFYCANKDVYFHPPCPFCGQNLQLCQDETLLSSFKLKSYSASLTRYLYCPNCVHQLDQPEFYVYARESTDPPIVKDQKDLINSFGNLLVKSSAGIDFPCLDCDQSTTCYGAENQLFSRVFSYSFYPFYLLMFEGDLLKATDFLALVSGKPISEFKDATSKRSGFGLSVDPGAGRQGLVQNPSYLFSPDNEKNFLEILYLKLSFLGELMKMTMDQTGALANPDYSLSIDRLWVHLADQDGLLPSLWHFRLSILDIAVAKAASPHLTKYPPFYSLYFLGHIWFFTLLVNHKQKVGQVRTALEKIIPEMISARISTSESLQQKEDDPVFRPENIYWRPDNRKISSGWHRFWENALDLGGMLLVAGMNRAVDWSNDVFRQNFQKLRDNIQAELLGRQMPARETATRDNDSEILTVLQEILRRWQFERKTEQLIADQEGQDRTSLAVDAVGLAPDEDQEEQDTDEEMLATVILAPDKPKKNSVLFDQMGDETVILTPEDRQRLQALDDRPKDEDLMMETVILRSEDLKSAAIEEQLKDGEQHLDDLPETVHLSPSKKNAESHAIKGTIAADSGTQGNKQAATHLETAAQKEDLSDHLKSSSNNDEDDDLLAKTVILHPDKKVTKEADNE
jgi:hypothetical protein